MEGHTENLMNLCRLCCVKIQTMEDKYSFTMEIKIYKNEVIKLFDYNITSNKECIHPIYVCDTCQPKLDRCCNSEVESTKIAEIYGHNLENCTVCLDKVKKHNFYENEGSRWF